MGRFPVHSGRQFPISLWFNNGVKEGDGPILLIVLHCKLNGRVNTVDVLYKVLFMDFLLDDKCVIHIPVSEPGGWGQY